MYRNTLIQVTFHIKYVHTYVQLRVYENRVLWRKFGFQRGEVK